MILKWIEINTEYAVQKHNKYLLYFWTVYYGLKSTPNYVYFNFKP